MENCTIYSHYLNFDKVIEIVKTNLPKAKIEQHNEGVHRNLVATIKGGFFGKTKTLTINSRQRKIPSYKLDEVNCELTQNLEGMVNYIASFPAKNEAVRNKFLHKVMAVNCEMPFMAEPEITPEFKNILALIIKELDAYVFAQPNRIFNKSSHQHFLDKNFNLILDAEGNCEIEDIEVNAEAKYHDEPFNENATEGQSKRKADSESFLRDNGIKINQNLPFVEDINDVEIRSLNAVIGRAYALLLIAAKGEGVEQEHLLKAINEKQINSLSPEEERVFKAEQLTNQEQAYATWRYESLYVLLWALGLMEDLKYPSDICDVPAVVSQIFTPTREAFEASVKLRSKEEILDELDKTYRMNWACVDARIKGQQVGGNINPSVIYERHYALNWLTNYLDQDWDDVQTNT